MRRCANRAGGRAGRNRSPRRSPGRTGRRGTIPRCSGSHGGGRGRSRRPPEYRHKRAPFARCAKRSSRFVAAWSGCGLAAGRARIAQDAGVVRQRRDGADVPAGVGSGAQPLRASRAAPVYRCSAGRRRVRLPLRCRRWRWPESPGRVAWRSSVILRPVAKIVQRPDQGGVGTIRHRRPGPGCGGGIDVEHAGQTGHGRPRRRRARE